MKNFLKEFFFLLDESSIVAIVIAVIALFALWCAWPIFSMIFWMTRG